MPLLRRVLASLVLIVAASTVSPHSAAAQTCTPGSVFSPITPSVVGAPQRHIEAADLNADGIVDLVISTGNAMVIALGAVDAGGAIVHTVFETHAGFLDPTGTAIADFDGDGIKDIA